jgi:adenylate cyclase
MTSTVGARDDVLSWLQSAGMRYRETQPFLEAFARKLLEAGVDLSRMTTGIHILHPQIDASSCLWQRDKPVTERRWKMDRAILQNSPMAAVYVGQTVRQRLEAPPRNGEFPIFADLRAEGVTDYLALPLPFSDGSWKAVSYATSRPGGFSDDQVALLASLVPAVAPILEIQTLHRTTLTLLDTYVGPTAGRRVLDGAIKRGMCDAIRAVIWTCDLRGFTDLSERLQAGALIGLLNDYFGVMTAAIERHGGEVLKFIGDAMLAIFPLAGGEDRATADRALAAAREVEEAIDRINQDRDRAGQPVIRFGLALHVGEVLYGNIGGANRLDFTVIGPAVNLVTRIEGLCKPLGRSVLLSADFAALCDGGIQPLGAFPLKGIEKPTEIFAPAAPVTALGKTAEDTGT